MMLLLVEAAVRTLLLGLLVGCALTLWRTRNPQVEMTAWVTVLAAGLAMPLLMQWTLFRLPTALVMLPHVLIADTVPASHLRALDLRMHAGAVPMPAGDGWSPLALLPFLYGTVAAILLLRLATGLMMTWRIVRDARPIRADWTRGADVRVTARILAPVTFGGVILVPISFITWSPAKRRAVMGHELSHIEHHDFTIQVLSQLHSALFWFSPFAWWLQVRLAALAETTSDEAAIQRVGDRVGYAEILLDIAVGARRGLPAGIAMARPALLRRRVEHILSAAAPTVTLAPRRRLLLAAALVPGALLIGGLSWHPGAAMIGALPAIPAVPALPAIPAIPPIPALKPVAAAAGSDGRPFAILTGGHSMISAGGRDLDRLLGARDKVGGEAILFLRDDTLYAVTDPVLVEDAADLFRPENDLADQERELAQAQKELGQEQADLGRQQGDLGRQMSEAAQRYARQVAVQSAAAVKASLGEADTAARDEQKQAFKETMAELGEQQKELGREQGRLGAEQAKLGAQQGKLGREQSHVAHQSDVRLSWLLDKAITDGSAKPL